MSKSLGNVVNPESIVKQPVEPAGVDTLRLWVASSDYTADISIGDSVLSIRIYNSVLMIFRKCPRVTKTISNDVSFPSRQSSRLFFSRYSFLKSSELPLYSSLKPLA